MFIPIRNGRHDPHEPIMVIADLGPGEVLEVLPGSCHWDARAARMRHLRLRIELDVVILVCSFLADAQEWLDRRIARRDGRLCACSCRDFNGGLLCQSCGLPLTQRLLSRTAQ